MHTILKTNREILSGDGQAMTHKNITSTEKMADRSISYA